MVKYNRTTVIFDAVVNNLSREICWPTDRALALFKRYHLDVVKVESLGLFRDYESLCNALYQAFRNVAKSTIAEDEEGSVLYLVKRSDNASEDRVLSLAKLKTLESRIFRKIREKLRGFFRSSTEAAQKNPKGVINTFVKEMRDLMEGNTLP